MDPRVPRGLFRATVSAALALFAACSGADATDGGRGGGQGDRSGGAGEDSSGGDGSAGAGDGDGDGSGNGSGPDGSSGPPPAGSGVTYADIGGNLAHDAFTPSAIFVDEDRDTLAVFGLPASTRPSLRVCNRNGTECTARLLDGGRGFGSGRNASAAFDVTSKKLLVVSDDAAWTDPSRSPSASRVSLFRCELDGTGCTTTDITSGDPSVSERRPRALVDAEVGRLLVPMCSVTPDDMGQALDRHRRQLPAAEADAARVRPRRVDVHRGGHVRGAARAQRRGSDGALRYGRPALPRRHARRPERRPARPVRRRSPVASPGRPAALLARRSPAFVPR
jgi:hypothetical protein